MRASRNRRFLEVSDVIVEFDPSDLSRRPVQKSNALRICDSFRDRRARRIVEALPAVDDVLDPDAVDSLLIRVHCERQRISEEFEQAQRIAKVVGPIVEAIRSLVPHTSISLVDVGCANGYAIRSLAANQLLPGDLRLVGMDFNPALVANAQQLADEEGLKAEFITGNALTQRDEYSIVMSTGVAHHIDEDHLVDFFRQHDRPGTFAFLHFDLQPTLLSIVGTWMLHQARVELPLTRHDGLNSARRAYQASDLIEAAERALPAFRCGIYPARFGPFPGTVPAVVGLRPDIWQHVASKVELR